MKRGRSFGRVLERNDVKGWRFLIGVITVAVIMIAVFPLVRSWWTMRQWFGINSDQQSTIMMLTEHPPRNVSKADWEDALAIVPTIWGNVTFHPDYSGLSKGDMHALHLRLKRLVAQSNRDNAYETADSVFEMMHEWSPKTRFIEGYRDQFRRQVRYLMNDEGLRK